MNSQQHIPEERSASEEQTSVANALELFRRLVYTHSPFNDPVWLTLDLTMAQLRGLRVIVDGASTINEVAGRLEIAQPTASLLIDRLVRRGLVQRVEDPNDRRRTLVSLTTAGSELITRLRGDRRERVLRALARLSEDDLAALSRGLRALTRATGDDAGEAASD